MHELSLAGAIVDAALRRAAGWRVTAVRVRIGALRQALPDSLASCFELAAQGTDCEGAQLEHDTVPACLACRACGAARQVDELPLRCAECGSDAVDVVTGTEFEIESIVLEEPSARD